MNNWTVYKHIFPDGKVYIGITSLSPNDRWKDGFGYSEQRSFFKQIVKTGWENIRHEIVASGVSEDIACSMEKELIKQAKNNALNVQHRQGDDLDWIKLPICSDIVADRKIKFRRMSDRWLDKVRYKDTVPFDWFIEDMYIDFKYATEDGNALYVDTIRVPIPENITYSGLYDYLYWRLDFGSVYVLIDSTIIDKSSMECCKELGISRATWYNKLKEVR